MDGGRVKKVITFLWKIFKLKKFKNRSLPVQKKYNTVSL